MAKTPEKLAFSERLKQALKRNAKRIEGPSALAVQFNLCYSGKPVTNQAVQKWLSGENRPAPDKIEVLAAMLNVSYHWLRFGIHEAKPLKAPAKAIDAPLEDAPTAEELKLVGLMRRLPVHHQELLRQLANELAIAADCWDGQA